MDDRSSPYVAYRPYSESASSQTPKRPKIFKPQRPAQSRAVEKASLSSQGPEESVGNVLHAAMRRQSADFATGRSNAPPERFSGMSLKSFGMSATVSGTAAPRKAKERKDGRSMELMDLAFSNKMQLGPDGQYVQQYTPISLPYFDIQEEGEASTDAPTQAQTRPKLMHIDEANSRAAAKLLGAQQELLEDTYFLMQMPCVLPEMRNPEDEVFREQEDALSAGAGSTITRLPDGKLGKLRIYKSGKVRMEIAGVSFCVDQGCDTFFQQDLALVCPLAGEIFNLGNINTRRGTGTLQSVAEEDEREKHTPTKPYAGRASAAAEVERPTQPTLHSAFPASSSEPYTIHRVLSDSTLSDDTLSPPMSNSTTPRPSILGRELHRNSSREVNEVADQLSILLQTQQQLMSALVQGAAPIGNPQFAEPPAPQCEPPLMSQRHVLAAALEVLAARGYSGNPSADATPRTLDMMSRGPSSLSLGSAGSAATQRDR